MEDRDWDPLEELAVQVARHVLNTSVFVKECGTESFTQISSLPE